MGKKKSKDIMSMSDKEWERLLDEVAGERAETVEQTPDPRYTERHEGTTPLGGDYSVAYYYDEQHAPCEKSRAKFVNIVIYTNDGERVYEVYSVL